MLYVPFAVYIRAFHSVHDVLERTTSEEEMETVLHRELRAVAVVASLHKFSLNSTLL